MRPLTIFCLLLLACSDSQASEKVKVFILAGQSNMEGKAAASTLERVLQDAQTRKRFEHLQKNGKWVVREDVFVAYPDRQETPVSPNSGPLSVGFGSSKRVRTKDVKRAFVPGIGPELGIGWVLGEHFEEPVLLIKTAWGGRAVKHTFRPPSAMPTDEEIKQRLLEIQKKNPAMTFAELKESYGSDYRKTIEITQTVLKNIGDYVPGYEKSAGYEMSGFIWFQGWNDGVGQGNPEYVSQMKHFIKDIRRDLKQPDLPFVIGELGIDGPKAEGWIAKFREQQAALASAPEFKGTAKLAKTAHLWPTPPILSREWQAFRESAKNNELKAKDNPTRIDPGKFYQTHWAQKYKDQLAYTSDRRYHYLGSGQCYYEMGESMGKAMLELLR